MMDYFEKLKIPTFNLYWENYGGFKTIVTSQYFRISLLLTTLLTIFVVIFGESKGWYEHTLNTLPDILGFSIASFAILISLGDNKFRKKLSAEKDSQKSTPFMIINSSFVHFIFIQIIAILFALISQILVLKNIIFFFIGMFLLIYAVLLTLAATLGILQFSLWYQDFLNNEKESKNEH